MRPPLACIVILALAGCQDTVGGQEPIGGQVDSEAELQRYLRRLALDLSGAGPTEDELAEQTAQLAAAGNTAAARGALVDELMQRPAFSARWIEELEGSIFGGNTVETQYATVCGIIRGTDPACLSCAEADPCACSCPAIGLLRDERARLRSSADDLASGVATSTIERNYAGAIGYFALAGAPEARVRIVFDDFLARQAEADEVENGRAMILGSLVPGAPAGLLFHRHGASYDDLVDILFDSEVYREAVVRRVFERYLAREPSAAELTYFTSTLDAAEPDARALVRAVVSSREYFAQ